MPPSATARLWGWPVTLGLLTAVGLTTALVSEGWGDVVSWFGLGLPLGVIARHAFGAVRNARRPPWR